MYTKCGSAVKTKQKTQSSLFCMLTRLFLFMSPCPCKNLLCLYKCYFGVLKKNIIIKPLIVSHHLEKNKSKRR